MSWQKNKKTKQKKKKKKKKKNGMTNGVSPDEIARYARPIWIYTDVQITVLVCRVSAHKFSLLIATRRDLCCRSSTFDRSVLVEVLFFMCSLLMDSHIMFLSQSLWINSKYNVGLKTKWLKSPPSSFSTDRSMAVPLLQCFVLSVSIVSYVAFLSFFIVFSHSLRASWRHCYVIVAFSG